MIMIKRKREINMDTYSAAILVGIITGFIIGIIYTIVDMVIDSNFGAYVIKVAAHTAIALVAWQLVPTHVNVVNAVIVITCIIVYCVASVMPTEFEERKS